MDELQYELKIPKERIAVLIGKGGSIKKEIEESTETKLEIDSREGDIFIRGDDGLKIYTAKVVVTAIGRGFNPEIALLLLKSDYSFELVSLSEYGKSKESQQRIKGRIIGKEGKTRELIEQFTSTYISVYGKTVAIIGTIELVTVAHRAVMMLIEGSLHSTVYKWLEKKQREIKHRELSGENIEWRK